MNTEKYLYQILFLSHFLSPLNNFRFENRFRGDFHKISKWIGIVRPDKKSAQLT